MTCCLSCKKCSVISLIGWGIGIIFIIVLIVIFMRGNKTYMEWLNRQYIDLIIEKHSPSIIFDITIPILHKISFCCRDNENITQIIEKL